MIKDTIKSVARAALARISRTGLTTMQAGARSAQSNAMNYLSVTTLDPSRLASAFSSADQGYITDQSTLFELVEEQDSHIFSELAKRRRYVTGLGWQLMPKDDASQSELDRTKELEDMLRSIPRFQDAQYDLLDAVGKGFAAMEFDWKTGSTWLPKEMVWVPQRMFQLERTTGQLQYLNMGMPEPLREWGWVVHQHKAKSGYIEQAALFRVLAWTYAYKAYNIRDMQRFLELYGLPLRLGKYPAGIDPKQRSELLKAVRNIGNDGAGIVPQTMTIDFIQAASGKIDDFTNSISYWERKQSLAILGGTLTSQADGKTSTNALGVIHDKVRREIMLHDVSQLEPTMDMQVARPIALVNGMFSEDRLPSFKYQTEETVDQAKMADVLDKAANMGMEIDVEYAHKVMQIPQAKAGAKLLKPAGNVDKTAIPPADSALVRLVALAAQHKQGIGDITSAYAAQLADLCAPHERAMIQQVASIISEAGDFETALEGIAALTSRNPQWATDVALGMSAADLAGRDDAGVETPNI